MAINIPEHIINKAAVSAQSGAFFSCGVTENKTGWWTEELYGQNPEGARSGKARLVKRRKSQTQQKRDENPRSKQSLLSAKASSLDSLYSHALKNLTPEQRSERLGINHDEIVCLETDKAHCFTFFDTHIPYSRITFRISTGIILMDTASSENRRRLLP